MPYVSYGNGWVFQQWVEINLEDYYDGTLSFANYRVHQVLCADDNRDISCWSDGIPHVFTGVFSFLGYPVAAPIPVPAQPLDPFNINFVEPVQVNVSAEREVTPTLILVKNPSKPFFMPYDTVEEIRLRLEASVIRLDNTLVYVSEVTSTRKPGVFNIHYTEDVINTKYKIHEYKEGSGFDLSPLPPRYIPKRPRGRYTQWIYRRPVRNVYKQGACLHNTYLRNTGDNESVGSRLRQIRDIFESYAERETIGVEDGVKSLSKFGESISLSEHVALHHCGTQFAIEYHGRTVGKTEGLSVENFQIEAKTKFTPFLKKRLYDVGVKM